MKISCPSQTLLSFKKCRGVYDYQIMEKSDILVEMWECKQVKVTEEDGVAFEETASFLRMDALWPHINCKILA